MSDQPGLRLVPITADRPGTVKRDGEKMPSITAALDGASPGSVVTVGRGRYGPDTETFPLRVPAGVTLRGPEPPDIPEEARKFLPTPPPAALVADTTVVELSEDRTQLAHLKIRTRFPGTGAALTICGVRETILDTCEVAGSVEAAESTDVQLRWTSIEHGRLVCRSVQGFQVTGGTLTGTHGSEPLIQITDSPDARIEAMAITDATTGVDATRCERLLVGGCAVLAEGSAVRCVDSGHVRVSGNRLRGSEAVQLIGCVDAEIAANGIERADTAIDLVDCEDTEIGFNHIAEAGVDVSETPS